MSAAPPTSPVRGTIACLAAAALWASNGVVSKYLMNAGVSPFALAQGRVTFGALLAVAWLAARRPEALRIRIRDLARFGVLGSVGLAAVNACYLGAIARIPTAAAILLQYLAPVFIAVYAWRFMGERLGAAKVGALALAVAGSYLVVGGYNVELAGLNRWGVAWGLAAAVSFAFYCVYSEYGLRSYPPWTVLCYALVGAAATWTAALGPARLLSLGWDTRSWTLVAYSASFGTLVPFGLFAYGVEHLRATRATIVATAEPVLAAVFAYLWLGEQLEGWQLVGGALVLAAVVWLQRQREHDRLAPAALREGAGGQGRG